jgi:hypothetical protein
MSAEVRLRGVKHFRRCPEAVLLQHRKQICKVSKLGPIVHTPLLEIRFALRRSPGKGAVEGSSLLVEILPERNQVEQPWHLCQAPIFEGVGEISAAILVLD